MKITGIVKRLKETAAKSGDKIEKIINTIEKDIFEDNPGFGLTPQAYAKVYAGVRFIEKVAEVFMQETGSTCMFAGSDNNMVHSLGVDSNGNSGNSIDVTGKTGLIKKLQKLGFVFKVDKTVKKNLGGVIVWSVAEKEDDGSVSISFSIEIQGNT